MEPIGTYRTARGRLALVTEAWNGYTRPWGIEDLTPEEARTFRAFYRETDAVPDEHRECCAPWRRRPAGA